MKLKVKASFVAAIAQFRAVNDLRYYLAGAYVQPLDSGGVLVVASNGHTLGLWRDPDGECERAAILKVTPALITACKGSDNTNLHLVNKRLTVIDSITMNEKFVQGRDDSDKDTWEIEGKFPDWRRIVPEEFKQDGPCDAFNVALTALASSALNIGLGKGYRGVGFFQNTKAGAIAVLSCDTPDFMALVMPMNATLPTYPAWIVEAKKKSTAQLQQQMEQHEATTA